MRGRGEIALLADIARPHVGVITNVAARASGPLGSLEEVARAKGELFAGLGPEGIAVLPAGEPLLEAQAASLPEARKRRFGAGRSARRGRARSAARRAICWRCIPAGAGGSVLRFAVANRRWWRDCRCGGTQRPQRRGGAGGGAALGRPAPAAARALSNVVLAAAPLAAGRWSGADAGRLLQRQPRLDGAAWRVARRWAPAAAARGNGARAFAILGDMLELGPAAKKRCTRRSGAGGAAGLAGLVDGRDRWRRRSPPGPGPPAWPAARSRPPTDPAQAAAQIAALDPAGDWILVKASRGMRLERVIEALGQAFAAAAGP